jgi:hypothetical protein
MNDDPQFIADASLSGLARWLRLLGYDTVVFEREAGRSMMRQAQADQRILLTRRRDMMERQFSGRVYLIPHMKTGEQLTFIVHKLALDIKPEKMHTLCLSCNTSLTPVEKERICDLVPEFVFEHCGQYHQCPKCRKIYWPGTHGQNALRFLEKHHINISG